MANKMNVFLNGQQVEWLPSKYTLSFYFSQTGFQEAYSTKVSFELVLRCNFNEVVCDV